MTSPMKRRVLLLLLTITVCSIKAQRDSVPADGISAPHKEGVLDLIEREKNALPPSKKINKTNFDRWDYSEKDHAIVGYYGTIFQTGFNDSNTAVTWHHDLGAFYRGYLVKKDSYRLNAQVWVEQNSLIAGDDPKKFSQRLGMFSGTNGSDTEGHEWPTIEYLYFENFFFDGFLDITLGKIDPLFLSTFTSYAGWDKMTFFSKTAASDPVPDLNAGFGFYTGLNITDNFEFGVMMVDDNARNDYFDPVNFFYNTSYSYQALVSWKIPTRHDLYSTHILSYYYVEPKEGAGDGRGYTYVANQGLSKKHIITIKASQGSGRVTKYNGAYALGLIFLNAFQRPGDQFGTALLLNEKGGKYEYGLDSYYKLFIKPWITFDGNLQLYYTPAKTLNVIPGIRAMITY